jgi:hypothetical protein
MHGDLGTYIPVVSLTLNHRLMATTRPGRTILDQTERYRRRKDDRIKEKLLFAILAASAFAHDATAGQVAPLRSKKSSRNRPDFFHTRLSHDCT